MHFDGPEREIDMSSGHVLKKKLVRSSKWRKLDCDFARLTYTLLISAIDSWGMILADGLSLKYNLGPFDNHTPEDYEIALKKLEEVDLVRTWSHQEDRYLYVVGHDREHSLRKRSGKPVVPRPAEIVGEDATNHDGNVIPEGNNSVTSGSVPEGVRKVSGRCPEVFRRRSGRGRGRRD